MRLTTRSNRQDGGDGGYTVVELLIALTLGAVVLASVIGSLIVHMRSMGGDEIREDLNRNVRYVGTLLGHDLQLAGVGIKSNVSFGTVAAWPGSKGDTLTVLHLPYQPVLAPPHDVDPTVNGGVAPAAGEGTCGPRCIDLLADDTEPLDIAPGDLARLQVGATRRLLLLSDVVRTSSTQIRVEFTAADTLLRRPAGLVGSLQIQPNSSYVQKLEPIVYFIDDQDRLLRAGRLAANGQPVGEIVAFGVEEFQVILVFADGDELDQANPFDSDPTNDFDDITGVRVRVTVRAERTDPRVNDGQLLRKTSEWLITPRNLRYEKNRI